MLLLRRRRPAPLFISGRPLGISLAITPALGSELITNGDFETGDPPTGWSYTTATASQVTDNRTGSAGTKALSMTGNGGTADASRATAALSANTWYQLDGWAKAVSASASGLIELYNNSWASIIRLTSITAATWTQDTRTGLCTVSGTGNIELTGGASTKEVRYDDISAKALTHASLFSEPYDAGRQTGLRVTSRPTVTARTQCGHILCALPDLSYYLMAYHDGTNAILRKYEGGTYTSLVSAAATYAAGAKLEVRVTGILSSATVQLWYNGSQVGTNQTVDLSSYGRQLRGFSTLSTNKVGSLVLEYT